VKQAKGSANRMKYQISTSESRENACIFFTERGRDSTKLNLFEYLLYPYGQRPKGSEMQPMSALSQSENLLGLQSKHK